MTAEDFRGLMPLIYGHISPYGTFLLDMASRLNIEPPILTVPTRQDLDNPKARRQSRQTLRAQALKRGNWRCST